MKPGVSNFINVALFYLGWFGIVLTAQSGAIILPLALTALALLIFTMTSANKFTELRLVGLCCAIGVALDILSIWLGAFKFTTPPQLGLPYPLWMICLWIIFGTTLRRSLNRVVTRPTLGGIFGAIGGPLSYLAAEALHVLSVSQPRFQSLLIIGVEWLAVMMIYSVLVGKHNE